MRARGKAGRAGRRAGARVLVLSLVATVPGTGQPVALAGGPQPQVDPTGDVSGAPLQAAPPGGLTGPGWSPEPPSEQAEELATLSGLHAPSARLPFAKAAAVVALGPGQKALARRLLHAAPAGTRGVAPAPAAVSALAYAFGQIGKPYLWGGNGPKSYDCSGLTQQSYLHAGVLIPRTAAQQATVGVPVRLSDLLPGDLIFYAHDVHNAKTIHHVAMYAGDGVLVHAPQTGEVVHLSPVWLDEYIGAVRLVPAVPRGAGNPGGPVLGPAVPGGNGPTTPPASPTSTSLPTRAPSGTPTGTPTPSAPPPTTAPPPTSPPTTTDPPPSSSPTPSPTDPPTPTPTDPPTPTPTDPPTPTPTDTPTPTPATTEPAASPTPTDSPTATPSGP